MALQRKASSVGFDWNDPREVLRKIREEADEIETALDRNDADELAGETGDLLFALVNLARHIGTDPDLALRGTNAKFERRFGYIERRVGIAGPVAGGRVAGRDGCALERGQAPGAASFHRRARNPGEGIDEPAGYSGRTLTGGVGGLFSGFLGVTSGGVLVPLLVLLLGKDQHVAQGISLVAQVFPTSLSGVRNYSQSGHRISIRWLIWLAVGFCVGGGIGAILATRVADHTLQWCFVAYLLALIALMLLRPPRPKPEGGVDVSADVQLHWASLCAVGAVAGWSSGFLGIGGGLAITALMSGLLKLSQHRAQAMSLAVTALPVTIPAAVLYVQQGTELPWLTIISLIVGLWIGTDIGARFANRVAPEKLRIMLMVIITSMALFMAYKAAS